METFNRKQLGKILHNRRKQKGVTQNEININGLTTPTAHKIERGGNYTIESLILYSKILNVELLFDIKEI